MRIDRHVPEQTSCVECGETIQQNMGKIKIFHMSENLEQLNDLKMKVQANFHPEYAYFRSNICLFWYASKSAAILLVGLVFSLFLWEVSTCIILVMTRVQTTGSIIHSECNSEGKASNGKDTVLCYSSTDNFSYLTPTKRLAPDLLNFLGMYQNKHRSGNIWLEIWLFRVDICLNFHFENISLCSSFSACGFAVSS